METEDFLLLDALRSAPVGRPTRHAIRLHLLSSRAQDALNDLIQRLEYSFALLGMTSTCVRAEVFGLLGIESRRSDLRSVGH